MTNFIPSCKIGRLLLGIWLDYVQQVFIPKIQISFAYKLFITYDLFVVYIYNLLKLPLHKATKICYNKLTTNFEYCTVYTEKILKNVTSLPSSLVACCFTRVIGDLAGGLLSGWRQLLAVLVSPSILWLQNKNGEETPTVKDLF